MFTYRVFIAILLLSIARLIQTRAIPPQDVADVPVEAQLIALTTAIGRNSSAADVHQVFQTLAALSQAGTHRANHPSGADRSLHNQSLDAGAALCHWLSRIHQHQHQQHGFPILNHSLGPPDAGGAADSGLRNATADAGRDDHDACVRFVTEGVLGVKEIVHGLRLAQKQRIEVTMASASGERAVVEKRVMMWWVFNNGFSTILCDVLPSWCHEEN